MSIDYERLFATLPSPHMVLDRDFNFVAVNPAYERVTMRRKDELLGRNLFDLFPNPGESGRRLRASLQHVLDTGQSDTLAFIPYDIPVPEELGGGMEQRFWTAVHLPLPDASGRVTHVMQNTVDVTDIARLRQAASQPFSSFALGETRLLERAREAEEQHKALLEESGEFRRLFQQAPGFFAVLSGPDHVFTFANDAYLRLVGRPVIGMSVAQALPEVVQQGFVQMLDEVYKTGKPAGGAAILVKLKRSPDEEVSDVYLDFSYDAIRNRDGSIAGVFVQGMDRTEAVIAQRRQHLLLDELNHRVKNTLATVQSIAAQTLRSATDLASARSDFAARIQALSNAHSLLSAKEWSSTSLSDLLAQEFSAYGTTRFVLDGPDVTVPSRSTIAVALVVHELTTNAAKYGALSSPDGKVKVIWRRGGDGGLTIEWTERDGPPAQTPTRRGFGSRMIERVIAGELDGTFEAEYGPRGFACRLAIAPAALHDEAKTEAG